MESVFAKVTILKSVFAKATVWILLTSILTGQIFNSPGMMEWVSHFWHISDHYQEHKAADADLSFGQFFRMHFGDLESDHHDHHDHSDLPFQSEQGQDLFQNLTFQIYPPDRFFGEFDKLVFMVSKDAAYITGHYFFLFAFRIFQPPRGC